MPKTPATTETLRELGYEVGIAHGRVDVEEQALDEARVAGSPAILVEQAAAVAAETLNDIRNAGQLPKSAQARRVLAGRIAEMALEQLSERAEGRVTFHEQAVQIAQSSPDVWVITGPGVTNLYVACKSDGTGWDESQQEILDALADKEAHKERVKQHKAAG